MIEKLIYLCAGSLLTILGLIGKEMISRKTFVSGKLIESRLQSLQTIWTCYTKAKFIVHSKIGIGHEAFQATKRKDADEAVTDHPG